MGYMMGFPSLPRFPAYSLKNIAEICQTSFRLIRLTMAPLDNLTANSSRMEQVHFFLKNGRCHISLTTLTRANVVRAAKRFFLKGETMFYRFDDQASPRRPGPKSRQRSRSADLPTVMVSPYLVRFGGSKYGVTAVLQIIRQRAAAAEKIYITQIHSRWRHWRIPRFTQQMAHWFQSRIFVSGIPS